MKSIQISSTSLLLSCDKNENILKNYKIEKKIDFNEIKSNKNSFIKDGRDNNISNQKLNAKNIHERDESIDISFFLSKDLKEKIEGGDEPINNEEIEFYSNGKLNYFFNKDNNIDLQKDNLLCKNVNNSFANGNPNLNETNKVNNYSQIKDININQFNINENYFIRNLINNREKIIPQDNDLFKTQNLINFQKNQINFNLPQNSINENNNIYLLNNNLINSINQNINQINNNFNFPGFDSQNNSIFNTNFLKYQPKRIIDNFTLEMFGKRGWICQFCNNFNYQTRKKCNRCHNKKQAKKLKKLKNLFSKEFSEKFIENGWYCNVCGNFNYSFRIICNRCKLQKKLSVFN
mgnify:CR=1 FL=1